MKNKVPMINIIIIALFNYVFLGTEYMYDNMMLYVINSNGVVNAQNYILGVSVAGFLMYPVVKACIERIIICCYCTYLKYV